MKKFKRLVTAVVALTIGASSVLALASCDKDDEDVKKDDIVSNVSCDNGHDYGAWEIVKEPTPFSEGLAQKTCNRNANHEHVTVKLPALTIGGDGYDSYKEKASDIGVPLRTYTLAKEGYEDIVVPVYTAFTVNEAVAVGKYNNDKVVSGDITAYKKAISGINEKVNVDLLTEDQLDVPSEFSGCFYAIGENKITYAFGDDYVEIKDGSENFNIYYDKYGMRGELFPVREQWSGGGTREDGTPIPNVQTTIKDLTANENYFDGYGFYFTWFYGETRNYGAGNFLNWLYTYGQQSAAINDEHFTESFGSNDNGDTVCSFSYNYYENKYGEHLCYLDVSFTVDGEGVITEFSASCKVYVNESTNTTFAADANGGYNVIEGKEHLWKDYSQYTVTQTTEYGEDGKPSNPYNYEDMLVTSFDYTVNNQPVSNATNVEPPQDTNGDGVIDENDDNFIGDDAYEDISADVNAAASALFDDDLGAYVFDPDSVVYIVLDNVTPSTHNFYFDEFHVLVYDETGETFIEEIIMDQNRSNEGHFFGHFNVGEEYMTFRSLIAGDYTLVIKTVNITESFKVHVPFVAPTEFNPSLYVFDEVEDSGVWLNPSSDFVVYAGQSLSFTSTVAHPYYEDATFTATATSGATITTGQVEGKDVSVFSATVPGTYTVTMTSNTGNVKTSFTVLVKEAPAADAMFSGSYTAGNYDVTFDNGTVTIDKAGTTTTANYTYDAATKKVTLSNLSGAETNKNFAIVVSDQYNLFLTYDDGFGHTSRDYMEQGLVNSVVGFYVIASSEDVATVLTANVAGTYSFKLPAAGMCFYRISDAANPTGNYYNKGTVITFTLEVGDKIAIWSSMGNSGQTVEITMAE